MSPFNIANSPGAEIECRYLHLGTSMDQSDLSQDFQVDDTFTFWMDISKIHQAGGGCPYPAAAHPRTILKY